MLVLPLDEVLIRFGVCLLVLGVLDFGFAFWTKARYFWLHGIWNMIITAVLLPDFIHALGQPHVALTAHSGNNWSVIQVASLHIWHMLAYSGLTADDYFHHIVFAGIMCVCGLGWSWGRGASFFIMFVCGFPGGLDYLFLAWLKHGWIEKIQEKRWNATINTWMRAPGCVVSGAFIYVCWMNGVADHIPWPIKLLMVTLCATNGQYYGRRVVASWAVHEQELRGTKKEDKSQGPKPSPLDQKLESKGWQSFGFSPQTRKTIAESVRDDHDKTHTK